MDQNTITDEVHDLDTRLTTHEAVCEQRYKGIEAANTAIKVSIGRIERILLAVTGTLILGMGGIIWTLLQLLAAEVNH